MSSKPIQLFRHGHIGARHAQHRHIHRYQRKPHRPGLTHHTVNTPINLYYDEVRHFSAAPRSFLLSFSSSFLLTLSCPFLLSLTLLERMISLALYRKQLYAYLEEKMATVAPNLSALIGETVAARLIQKAGSLTSLAKCPASTVQILGAEKALFRALKTKGNTPKYGLIYHSSFIGRASAKNKGRISRYLSNKCAIASRIDSFIEEPTSAYGKTCASTD